MRKVPDNIKALQLHRITPAFQLCGTWHTPYQLEQYLIFLREHDIPLVLPGEADAGIILTFDDGEQNIYRHAFPVLKKYDARAVVFLVGEYVGKKNCWDVHIGGTRPSHLSWQEIEVMHSSGIEFGSHTMTHRNLTRLKPDDMMYEIAASKRLIESRLGKCRCISYPFNRANERVIAAVRKAGYEYGFGGDGQGPFLIKKEALYITDTCQTLAMKIREVPPVGYRYERMKQKVINFFTIATLLLSRKH